METELERMVVRLVGDNSGYRAMLEQAQADTVKTARHVEDAGKQIEGVSRNLQGFASAAMGALGALGLGSGLRGMLGAWRAQEDALISMRAAIESNGGDVDRLMTRYIAFANEIQDTTNIGDELTHQMLRQAEILGASGPAAERAVRNAIAAADGNAAQAESYIRVTAALEQGDVSMARMLRRNVPAHIMQIADEGQRAAAIQEHLARQFNVVGLRAGTASGKLDAVAGRIGDLMEIFGEIISEAILPAVRELEKFVLWVQKLDPAIHKAIVAVTALAAGTLALAPVVYVFQTLGGSVISLGSNILGLLNPLRLLFMSLTGIQTVLGAIRVLASTAFGPIGLAIGAVTAIAGVFVQQMGGLSETWGAIQSAAASAWGWIQDRVAAFMEWFSPIWDATVYLAITAWNAISSAVVALWGTIQSVFTQISDFISGVWESIGLDAIVDFGAIRDTIVNVIDFASFTIQNFGMVASYVWTSVKLAAVVAFDFIRDAVVIAASVVTGVVFAIGATFAALWNNLIAGAQRVFNFFRAGFTAVGRALTAIFRGRNPVTEFRETYAREIGRLNSSSRQFQDVGAAASTAFNSGYERTSAALGGVGPSRLQRDLRAEWEAEGRALGQSFEEFQRERMRESATIPEDVQREAAQEAGGMGERMGGALTAGVDKEVGKLDAVLAGSAEALSRITDYTERMSVGRAGREAGGRTTAPSSSGGLASTSPRAAGPSVRPGDRDPVLEQLRLIAGYLRTMSGRPTVTVTSTGIS